MYNDTNLVFNMHVSLNKRLPNNIEAITDRDERNHWRIVKQGDEWFDLNYALNFLVSVVREKSFITLRENTMVSLNKKHSCVNFVIH